ncbi:MAG: DUF2167 domain-containing protein [Flavobacteriales bacterium]|nr:DUF2167 domain-containing protein [Flavobacteriales bacterium]
MRPMAFALLLFTSGIAAQDSLTAEELEEIYAEEQVYTEIDSLIDAFRFENGEIILADGVATLDVPERFKFLAAEQAYHLVVDVWENPPSITEDLLGVVMAADAGVYADVPSYILYYEPIGYVTDGEADGIDYAAKLKDMLKDDSLANAQRKEAGYSGLQLLGWASAPYYDKKRRVLHWAKEMRSEEADRNVLNYNIRILGRQGVLVINAVSSMDHLDEVKAVLPEILAMATFNDGYRYDQYDPLVDKLAEQGLDGLIDGKTRERVKEFASLLVKVAIGAFAGLLLIVLAIWYFFIRKRR